MASRTDDSASKALEHVARLSVVFSILLSLYVGVVMAATDEALILTSSRLGIPVAGVTIGIRYSYFFSFGAVFLISAHAYLLLERARLASLLRAASREEDLSERRDFFCPAYLVDCMPLTECGVGRVMRLVSFMLALSATPLVLLAMKWRFWPVRDAAVFGLLNASIALDFFLILVYVALVVFGDPDWSVEGGVLLAQGIVAIAVGGFALVVAQSLLNIPSELPDSNLARWSPSVKGRSFELELWEPTDPDRVRLARRDLRFADLEQARLEGADLRYARLDGANLKNSDLSGTRMEGASLVGANLEGATLVGSVLSFADLRWANLRSAAMGGVIAREARFERAIGERVSFLAADLRSARFTGADFREADLRLADLSGAWLDFTWLVDADLDGARLPRDAYGSSFRGACLRGKNEIILSFVDLRQAVVGWSEECSPRVGRDDTDPRDRVAIDLASLGQLGYVDSGILEAAGSRLAELSVEPAAGSVSEYDLVNHIRVGRVMDLVDLACENGYSFQSVLDRASGVLPPGDEELELEISRELVRRFVADTQRDRGVYRSVDRCFVLDRQSSSWERFHLRWCGDDRRESFCEDLERVTGLERDGG